MDETVLKIWYIKEADLLSVSWNDKPSYYTTTDHGRVLADVDMEGNFKGFEIDGVPGLKMVYWRYGYLLLRRLRKGQKNFKKAGPEQIIESSEPRD